MTPVQSTFSLARASDFTLPGGEWFDGAGLGIFVHWSHISQQGLDVSWPLVGATFFPGLDTDVSVEEYHASAPGFNPTQWNAAAVARAVKRAGAQYVVFTARHHDGYSMFHTSHSEFGIENSPFGRDVTGELIDACRAEGLRIGLYYSLSNWHHKDYPAFQMEDRPYPLERWPAAGDPATAGTPLADDTHRRSSPEAWARYQDYLRGQLTELLSNYGTIDLLWFDGEWERSAQEWDTAGLHRLIKSLQPNVVINERLLGHGDYATPEQGFPSEATKGPWELCMTIGQMWGWSPKDIRNKSTTALVTTLIEVASRGGNLLLNVGPTPDGSISEPHTQTLAEIGSWMDRHAESVVGVRPADGVDFYGPSTTKDGTLYLHLVMRPIEQVIVRRIPVGRITAVRLLATGEELKFRSNVEVHEQFGTGEVLGEITITAPHVSGALIDVIAIDFR